MASGTYSLTAGTEIESLKANAGAAGLSLTGNDVGQPPRRWHLASTRWTAAPAMTRRAAAQATTSSSSCPALARIPSPTSPPVLVAGEPGSAGYQRLGITAATFAASVRISNGGGGAAMITAGAGSIRILNVAPASIDMTDFKFA